ncbi:type IV toxin-antitoxin system AbiEi family antitoxin domain-containing protein [Yinghuangia seranimata]|uniref:type IV toxin-antitoxin system AbiEi family antitoxin domain-containing protein n=1 Tax=Yinghuangia seranimata TaxID=408067 RepID=UPI00248CE252|nr:type IV toxin-antitoxin system AbiEi family antitoxin domain-containing protein [Yinghuangia seranimata]MDI2132495.1 type IV toxin-antitoxin system AbiEi family antitoxin domain-containing protein [Yinghuangia seranimata]
MTPRDDDRATALLAAPFTLAMAADHGITRSVVRRWLRDGAAYRVAHGVYAGSQVPDGIATRARAVALAVPPGAVVCGMTAAWLWGVRAAAPADGAAAPVEVAVPSGRTPPRRTGCHGRVLQLEDGDATRVAGVAVTSPARTAADVGRRADRDTAVAVLDGFLHSGRLTAAQLAEAVERFAGLPGARRFAAAAGLADGRSGGPEESRLRLAVLDDGLPAPVPGWEAASAFGRVLRRFALAWPDLRLAVDLEFPGPTAVPLTALPDVPAVRTRRRNVSGQSWRVVVCDPKEVTRNGSASAVVVQLRREMRDMAVSGSAAA